MKKFIITFFGNREVINEDRVLKNIVEQLEIFLNPWETINFDTTFVFYCGGYGRFDGLASEAIDLIRKKYPEVKTEKYLIIPYFNPEYLKRIEFLKEYYDDFIYPPLEKVPPKFAISRRNLWMIKESDLIFAYNQTPFGNTDKLISYAIRHGQVINIVDN